MTTARGGRPRKDQHPVCSVRHTDTGRAVAFCNGIFSGDPDLRGIAEAAYRSGATVHLGNQRVTVEQTDRGAIYAMLAACSGRGVIVESPETPLDLDEGNY